MSTKSCAMLDVEKQSRGRSLRHKSPQRNGIPQEVRKRAGVAAELVRRAERLLASEIDFIHSPEFDLPDADETILTELTVSGPPPRRARPPAGLPAYVASLYEVPLLNPREEAHLFRKLNYLKCRAYRLRARLNPKRPSRSRIEDIERTLAEAGRLRDRIARANLRLVVANARQFSDIEHPFEDLVSDGNLSLLQALEKFDYSRGFRFSTYATHAIRRTFFRRMSRRQREKTRLAFAAPDLLQDVPQPNLEEQPDPMDARLYTQLLLRMPDLLSDRELVILRARFSLETDEEAPTLQALARELGICKERVRQLQNRAIEKLRSLATELRSETEAAVDMIEETAVAAG